MSKMTFFEMRSGSDIRLNPIFSVNCDKILGFTHKGCGLHFLECMLNGVVVARVLLSDVVKFYIYEEDDTETLLYDNGVFYDTPYNIYHNEGGLHEI